MFQYPSPKAVIQVRAKRSTRCLWVSRSSAVTSFPLCQSLAVLTVPVTLEEWGDAGRTVPRKLGGSRG